MQKLQLFCAALASNLKSNPVQGVQILCRVVSVCSREQSLEVYEWIFQVFASTGDLLRSYMNYCDALCALGAWSAAVGGCVW